MDPDDYIKKISEELIESNVVDPYQFQFEHYLSIADLNNADISIFQLILSKM